MRRRDFFKSGTVFFGGALGASAAISFGGDCFIGNVMAQGRVKETFLSPVSITPALSFIVVAKDKGFFDEQGLDIAIQQASGTAASVTQLAAGMAMFSLGAAITSVPAIANQNAEVITVAQVLYKSTFEVAYTKEKPFNNPKDWANKTIGIMSVGGSTDQLVDAMMISSGADPKSVKKVVTGFSAGAYPFLQRGQVDAFMSFYSMRIALEAQGIQLEYVNTDEFAPIPGDSIIMSRTALNNEASRKTAVAFLRACAKGMRFILDKKNYPEAVEILAKYNPVEGQNKEAALRKFEFIATLCERPAGVPFMHCDDAGWVKGVELMARMGLIKPNAKPIDAYYTNDLIKMI